jgi:protein O-mannosyl-transferase
METFKILTSKVVSDNTIISLAISALLTGVFAGVTFERNAVWYDEVNLYRDAISKSPAKARVYYQIGDYYQDINNLENAEQYYLKATACRDVTDSSQVNAYYNLGIIYMKQAKIDLAIEAFTRAISLAPNDADALYKRGHLFYFIGEMEKARADIGKAVELNPSLDASH